MLAISLPLSQGPTIIAQAANGEQIASPTCGTTSLQKGFRIPVGMILVPSGPFTKGTRESARRVDLPAYAIGKFDVTNAEYKAFIDATGNHPPRYWKDGTYPTGKAAHPVAYVSLDDAESYAEWVSKATGWKVQIPTAEQWEKAARGPNGTLYPWGSDPEVSYRDGRLSTPFNFNAVTAVEYLTKHASEPASYDHPRSTMRGKTTTVAGIASYDHETPEPLAVSETGQVRGWVGHQTYTGFIYTDVFAKLNDLGGNTSPVGAYEAGKSAYGAYDMAGEIWNWTTTKITATNGAERGKEVNEIRGGSWYATGRSCVSVAIGEGRQGRGAYNTVGFRIVALPPFTR